MILRRPFERSRPDRDRTRREVVRGREVDVHGRLRRTSARGWGPWTDVRLALGPIPDGAVTWHVEDPVAVGLPATRGRVDADFAGTTRITVRPVRFPTEAFWGMDADIIVVQSERATTEIALPGALLGPVHERLVEQLAPVDRP